ncbi:MAG: GNAT family N-acetyltransferase [Calditrichota bacterium]
MGHRTELTFRPATFDDTAVLTKIAIASKSYWDYPQHWIELWKPGLIIDEEKIRDWHIHISMIQNEPAGFFALIPLGRTSILEHYWLMPEYIGKGYGRLQLNHMLNTAQALGIHKLVIDSDPQAEPFYLHCGARRVGSALSILEGNVRELPVLILTV